MAVTFKNDKKEDSKTAQTAIVQAKPDAADNEASQISAEAPEVIALKKQLSDAEDREKKEREHRIAAEKTASEANTKVVSSQNDAIKAQKSAIENAVQIATSNVNVIKTELKDAMESGDLAKQVDLQEKLADARWSLNNASHQQKQFATWEEQQKNAPKQVDQKPQYTKSEMEWIAAHPRFESDDEYYGVVAGADAAARRKGIVPDTKAYYEYVETALKRSGMEKDETQVDDGGRDTTGEDQQEEVVPAKSKPKLVMPAAPASNSSPTSSPNRSAKSFKLTSEMRDMAHRMFGPNSSHKLSTDEAEKKYAAHQLDIQQRRANGERV